MISVDPQLNMYDGEVADPRTYQPRYLPPAEVSSCREKGPRRPGCGQAWIASSAQGLHRFRRPVGADDRRSQLARVNSYSQVADSILFEGVNVGRHAKIRRAIIDKGVHVPAGIEIGYGPRPRPQPAGSWVTERGVTVYGQDARHGALRGEVRRQPGRRP